MCKYVGKIDKLFVRILIEDRGWVLSKTTNRKTMHWNEKAKLMLCAKDPFHFFFVGKTGPELPMFASDAPSFLAKRAPQRKNKHNSKVFFHIIFILCQDINKGCLSTPDGNVTCGFHFSLFFKTNPHGPVLVDTLSLSTKSSGVVLRVFICSLYEQQAKSRWLRCDRPELTARIVTTAVVSLAEQS